MKTQHAILALKSHFSNCNLSDHFNKETEAEYKKAIKTLSHNWRNISELPCEYEWYNTLQQLGIIERKNEPVYWQNQPRGFRVFFRLAA